MEIPEMTDEERAEEERAFEQWLRENSHKYKTERALSDAIKKWSFNRGVKFWEKKHRKNKGNGKS